MQNNHHIRIYAIAFISLILMTAIGCNKEKNKYSLPVLTTSPVIEIQKTVATSGGLISSDGGAVIKTCGICWSTNPTPTITDLKTTFDFKNLSFKDTANNLLPNTTYYVRAYACNIVGPGYGNILSFKTPDKVVQFNPNITYGVLTDNDGNNYKTVKIGTQTWMAENLKVTHYRNGDPIPNIKDETLWIDLSTGAYCDYSNSPENSATFGKLYNWFAVNDARNISPVGWHVASILDVYTLITYLGGSLSAAGKLKETGSTNWSTTLISTNESGFTALPGGFRSMYGKYNNISRHSIWWCSEKIASYSAFYWSLANTNSNVEIGTSDFFFEGHSVRLIMDN